jgi:hypothetical protein
VNLCVNNTRKTSHGANRNHVAEAAFRPIRRSRTPPENARTSATAAAASGPKRPTHKPGQVPKAVAPDFSASLGELLKTARRVVRRSLYRGFEVGPPAAIGRKVCLNGAAPQ